MSTSSAAPTDDGSLALRTYHLIHKVYVLLDAKDRRILGQFGLIGSQYRLLMQLNPVSGMRLTTLSERLLLSTSTVSRILDQLEALGWVQRVADPSDRRAQSVILTAVGKDMWSITSGAHSRELDRELDGIAANDLDQLTHLLESLARTLSARGVARETTASPLDARSNREAAKEVKIRSGSTEAPQ